MTSDDCLTVLWKGCGPPCVNILPPPGTPSPRPAFGGLSSQPLPRGSHCRGWQGRCGNPASAQGQSTQVSSVMIFTNLWLFQKARRERNSGQERNPWDGNNEPFITQNEIARKNKHPKKVHFIRDLRCPRPAGYKVLRVQRPGPRATVSPAPVPPRPCQRLSSRHHLAGELRRL